MKPDTKKFKYKREDVIRLLKSIARKEKVRLTFLGKDNGHGGYNYGGSTPKDVMLSPFIKAKKGDKVGRYEIYSDCDNPIECMLITFFHELSHAKLADKVPSNIKGYSWNDTSIFQYEMWITMLGIEYAHSKYGIKFSDQAVRWLIGEAMGYIRDAKDAKEYGYGLICTKATRKSYEVLSQWEFRGEDSEKSNVRE